MEQPPAAVVTDNSNDSTTLLVPAALPVANIKTEVGLNEEEQNNSSNRPLSVDGSEDVAPSPTTGDEQPLNPWTVVKCIFCQVALTPSEEPKLLECLHAACGNCISAKVNEHRLPGDAEISGMLS